MKNNKKIKILCIVGIVIALIVLVLCIWIANKKDIVTNEYDVEKSQISSTDNYTLDNSNREYIESYIGKLEINGDSIDYKIAISDDKSLYFNDMTNDILIKLIDLPMVTMKIFNKDDLTKLDAYVIAENGSIYNVTLNELDANKVSIKKLDFQYKVVDFANLGEYYSGDEDIDTVYVITGDGKVHNLLTNTIYSFVSYNLRNEYTIYGDYKISNNHGNYLKNDDEYYKFVMAVILDDGSMFEGNPDVIIFTEDYKIIYSIDNKLYVVDRIVVNSETNLVEGEGYYLTKLYMDDGTTIDLNGKVVSFTFNKVEE